MGEYSTLLAALLCLACLSCAYLFWRRRQSENYIQQFRERYFQLAAASNTYLFEYDVKKDLLRLSQPCAELLHLPSRLENYLDGHKDDLTGEQAQKGLALIEDALKLHTTSQQVRIERPDHSLGFFKVTSATFYESGSKPVCILGMFADETAEFQQQEKLTTRAQIDGLTRVYNAGTCRKQLPELVALYDHTQAAFIILDVDHFKTVNDVLGHQMGDKVLQATARTLKTTVRSTDFVGRLGGDEFCLYLKQVPSPEFIGNLCARINVAVTKSIAEENIQLPITVSIGAAMIHETESFEQLYARADKALYDAKRLGRNTYTVQI